MIELIMIAGALFVAWLLRKAFQGRCEAVGITEGHGAWVVLKVLLITVVVGFFGLLGLAMFLDHLNTGH